MLPLSLCPIWIFQNPPFTAPGVQGRSVLSFGGRDVGEFWPLAAGSPVLFLFIMQAEMMGKFEWP